LNIPRNCSSLINARTSFPGDVYTVGAIAAPFTLETDCVCDTPGDCHDRIVHYEIDGVQYNTTLPVLGQFAVPSLYSMKTDAVNVRIVPFECSGSQPFPWQAGPPDENSALFVSPAFSTPTCGTEFALQRANLATSVGFKYLMVTGASAYATFLNYIGSSITVINMHFTDASPIVDALIQNKTVRASFGPSFVGTEVVPGDAPIGVGVVQSDGTVTGDASHFSYVDYIVEESNYGGRDNIVWFVGGDGAFNKVYRADFTSPASPAVTAYEDQFNLTVSQTCHPTWVDASNNSLTNGCVGINETEIPFAVAFTTVQTWEGLTMYAFWSEGANDYAFLTYLAVFPCFECYIGGVPNIINLDIWQLNPSPSLVDRESVAVPVSQLNVLRRTTYANGFIYGTEFGDNANTTTYFPVSSGLGLDGWRNSKQKWVESIEAADGVSERRTLPDQTVLVSYYRWGTSIHNTTSGTPALTAHFDVFSAAEIATVPPLSGALHSCGSNNIFREEVVVDGTAARPYTSVEVANWTAVDIIATSTSTSTSTTSSTSSSSTSSSSTTSTSSSGGTPSPTRSPSPSSSSCSLPDVCKYDCSRPADPSKVPKPSVQPSKVPAASKVPAPEYFTVELTYESSAAECGADGPDCCEIREWLGDDSVAASFYLCSSDSTAKGRAPEYDSKDGTCTIFLAAQEGSDSGEITQAEFDSAIATLEASFSSLCPTDVKNCDVQAQSGKSFSYIVGGAGKFVASIALLCGALMIHL